MNFTSVACHVTLGSNVTKLHSAHGVYQLVFLSPEVLSNETWRDRVPSSVCQNIDT